MIVESALETLSEEGETADILKTQNGRSAIGEGVFPNEKP